MKDTGKNGGLHYYIATIWNVSLRYILGSVIRTGFKNVRYTFRRVVRSISYAQIVQFVMSSLFYAIFSAGYLAEKYGHREKYSDLCRKWLLRTYLK
jgi:hypothetical protein